MINEISVKPKPQNNNAKIAFLLSMLVFLVTVVSYFMMDKYRGIVGLAAISFLTVGILIYTKYISPIFYYDITFDVENTPIFVVRRIVGKRQETLARLDLADIVSAEIESADERKKHKTEAGVLKYNYCPTMIPPTSCRLFIKNRHESAEVLIEVSEEFANTLFSFAAEARSLRSLDEDEY